ncbi:MAG: hypothetical protein Q9185_003186 [Variospora sp. 1 TL-2023]
MNSGVLMNCLALLEDINIITSRPNYTFEAAVSNVSWRIHRCRLRSVTSDLSLIELAPDAEIRLQQLQPEAYDRLSHLLEQTQTELSRALAWLWLENGVSAADKTWEDDMLQEAFARVGHGNYVWGGELRLMYFLLDVGLDELESLTTYILDH